MWFGCAPLEGLQPPTGNPVFSWLPAQGPVFTDDSLLPDPRMPCSSPHLAWPLPVLTQWTNHFSKHLVPEPHAPLTRPLPWAAFLSALQYLSTGVSPGLLMHYLGDLSGPCPILHNGEHCHGSSAVQNLAQPESYLMLDPRASCLFWVLAWVFHGHCRLECLKLDSWLSCASPDSVQPPSSEAPISPLKSSLMSCVQPTSKCHHLPLKACTQGVPSEE